MLVSVIIPAFNREKTIRRAVDSAFAQTYSSIEVIVVDDGSSDGTEEILREYGEKLRLIRQKNAGASAARNTGIRAAHGVIIAFLDSDDAWLPDKIERQVALLNRPELAHVSCCICNTELIYADGSRKNSFSTALLRPELAEGIWLNPLDVLLTRFLLFNQAVAVRRSALDQVGYFRENLRIMEDYDLALRLATLGPWTFITDPLVTWYGGSDNSLSSSAKQAEIALRSQEILTQLCSSTTTADLSSHRLMKRSLGILRARLGALKLVDRPGQLGRLFGAGVLRALLIRESFFRRVPWFPKMTTAKIQPIATAPSSQRQ